MINRATLQTCCPLFTDARPKPYPNTQNITSILFIFCFMIIVNNNSGNKKQFSCFEMHHDGQCVAETIGSVFKHVDETRSSLGFS